MGMLLQRHRGVSTPTIKEEKIKQEKNITEKPLEEYSFQELRKMCKDKGFSFQVGVTKTELLDCLKK